MWKELVEGHNGLHLFIVFFLLCNNKCNFCFGLNCVPQILLLKP